MPNTAEDISIVLSGGSGNTDPNASLGGEPSITPIIDLQLNNLFSDVSPADAEEGDEDYRGFYVFNDGEETVFNVELWVHDEITGGSGIELGVEEFDEIQRITFSSNIPDSGSATFAYEGLEFIMPFVLDLDILAQSIQDGLNSLVDGNGDSVLETVTVTTPSSIGAPTFIFDVLFGTNDGKKNHDQIVVVENDLIPFGLTIISITTPQGGSPVNTIAPTIPNDKTPPANVGFFVPSEQSTINVPQLRPSEGYPVWIRRITEPDTIALANDGVTVRFRMETIQP